MKKRVALSLLLLTFGLASYSQMDTLQIKTSSQCGMCKEKIEKAMAYERGVESSSLDLKSQMLTVVYKTKRTNPEKIRKAVSMVGYDADDVEANARAYSKLPACCKKPEDPESSSDHCGG